MSQFSIPIDIIEKVKLGLKIYASKLKIFVDISASVEVWASVHCQDISRELKTKNTNLVCLKSLDSMHEMPLASIIFLE